MYYYEPDYVSQEHILKQSAIPFAGYTLSNLPTDVQIYIRKFIEHPFSESRTSRWTEIIRSEEQAGRDNMLAIENKIFIIESSRVERDPTAQDILDFEDQISELSYEAAWNDPAYVAEWSYLNAEYVSIPYQKHPIVRKCYTGIIKIS